MLEQRGVALADARAPGGRVVQVRCAGNAGRAVAGHALGLEHRFAGRQRAVGIADLDRADLLQAIGHLAVARFLGDAVERHVVALGGTGRLVAGHHIGHEAHDDEDGCEEGEKDRQQQLLGILDRTGVGFFGGLVMRVCAHGVLKIGGSSGGVFRINRRL